MRIFTTGMVYGVPSQKCEKYVNKWERKSQCTKREREWEQMMELKNGKKTPRLLDLVIPSARVYVFLFANVFTHRNVLITYLQCVHTDTIRYRHTYERAATIHAPIHQISAHTCKLHPYQIHRIFGLLHTDTDISSCLTWTEHVVEWFTVCSHISACCLAHSYHNQIKWSNFGYETKAFLRDVSYCTCS